MTTRQERALLAAGLALTAVLFGPLLAGHGLDLPDDYTEYALASWEWWRTALRSGANPFFVPGKLGGVSLYGDVVAMGPFYPAIWLGLLIPPHAALASMCVLHAFALLLGTRWLARTVGASAGTATLAGVAAAVGPLGMFALVDGRTGAWTALAWLPLVLGCIERGVQQRQTRWWVLAGLCLALALLGGHLRISAALCAFVALWLAVRAAPIAGAAVALGVGVLGGAPGWLPMLLEWRGASPGGGSRLAALAGPAESGFGLTNLPGLLSPRATVFEGDYGIGAVLLIGLLAVSLVGGAARLRILALLGLVAAASTAVPGLRWLVAPVLVLTHPVNDIWVALATVPAAAAAAVGLDRLRTEGSPRGAPILLGLLAAGILLALIGDADAGLGTPRSRWMHRAGLLQAVVVLGAAALAVRRRAWTALLLVGLLDLGLSAARIHTMVPSPPLDTDRRATFHAASFPGGYLDTAELLRLEGFGYADAGDGTEEEPDGPEGPGESWEEVAAAVQADLAGRAVPPHLGLRLGVPGLAGKAKIPPPRQVDFMLPVAEALAADPTTALDAGGPVMRLAELHGIGTVVGLDGRTAIVPPGAPRCRLIDDVEVVPDPDERRRRLLDGSWRPDRGLVESPLEQRPGPGELVCDRASATVTSEDSTLLVLRQRVHPGWRFRSAVPLAPLPVDTVHTGVLLPPGHHTVTWRFVPPGLVPALLLAGMTWVIALLSLFRSDLPLGGGQGSGSSTRVRAR